MYPHIPKVPHVNRVTLATRCAEGDHAAGVQLVELLWANEQVVTVDTVMMVARSAGVLTPVAFDRLYDAFEDASLRRYKREHGIEDPPAAVESD